MRGAKLIASKVNLGIDLTAWPVVLMLGVAGATSGVVSAQSAPEDHFERQILTRPIDPLAGTQTLGAQVRIDGRWAAAGAHTQSPVPSISTYERGPDGWVERTRIQPELLSPLVLSFGFGSRLGGLALRGDTLVAGVFGYEAPSPLYSGLVGYVQIHRRVGSDWVLDSILYHPNQANLTGPSGFGVYVALASENELLVLAGNDVRGGLLVFRRDASGVWQFVQEIPHPYQPGATFRSLFSLNFDTDGQRFVSTQPWPSWDARFGPIRQPSIIGERGQDGRWRIVDWIDAPYSINLFAMSTAATPEIQGNLLFLPVTGDECDPFWPYVDVYERDPGSGSWNVLQRLRAANSYVGPIGNCSATNDRFGMSVSYSDGRVAIGAPHGVDGGIPGIGNATIFTFDNGLFVESDHLRPTIPEYSSSFGMSVALEGDTALVGVPFTPVAATNQQPGAVYTYDLPRGAEVCVGEPNATGRHARLTVHGSPSAAVGDVYVVTRDLPAGAACLGLLGSAIGFTPHPGGSRGNLCLAGELGRFLSQVGPASGSGRFEFDVNAAALPLSSGARALAAGDAWSFQLWYRDHLPSGAAASNFSGAVRVTFD